jgi:hypothetical protein
MKKLLGITSDVFLFFFLLIIIILPVVVSFNLDPKLRKVGIPSVAGVTNITGENFINYYIDENIQKTERILVNNSHSEIGKYEVDFKVYKGSNLNESLEIGKIVNEGNVPVHISSRIFSDKAAMRGVIAKLIVNNTEQLLFDGKNFFEPSFELEPNDSFDIKLKLSSEYAPNYDFSLLLEIRGTEV